MQACPPDPVREQFFLVRVSRFRPVSRLAARFCLVRRDLTLRCRSVLANSPNNKAARARRAVTRCARLWQASPPRGRLCHRVPIWSRAFPSSKLRLVQANLSLRGQACQRLDDHFTKAHAQASRRVPVRVDRVTQWVQAVRQCAVEVHIPLRRY